MDRAGQQYAPEIYSDSEDWDVDTCFGSFEISKNLDVAAVPGSGKAVLGLGNQITPVETPGVENVRGTKDVDGETRSAFLRIGREPCLELPGRTMAGGPEPFPVFVEPSLGI